MASGTGHMQTRAVLPRGVGERLDKHLDGHIRGEMFVHLLSDEPGGQRRLQASGRHYMDRIAHHHHAVGHILRPAANGGGQRQSGIILFAFIVHTGLMMTNFTRRRARCLIKTCDSI